MLPDRVSNPGPLNQGTYDIRPSCPSNVQLVPTTYKGSDFNVALLVTKLWFPYGSIASVYFVYPN